MGRHMQRPQSMRACGRVIHRWSYSDVPLFVYSSASSVACFGVLGRLRTWTCGPWLHEVVKLGSASSFEYSVRPRSLVACWLGTYPQHLAPEDLSPEVTM